MQIELSEFYARLGATTPLSIICIGFMLSRADFKVILKKWRLIVTALIQLILVLVLLA